MDICAGRRETVRSAMLFVLVMLGTLLAGPRQAPEAIVWARTLPACERPRESIWDPLLPWFAAAVAIAAIAYVIPLSDSCT